jgi:S1-C subfamily serine protease
VALLSRGRRLGLRVAPDLDPQDVARRVVDTLKATPEGGRDEWFLPTLAEASLGLGDWEEVERNLKSYVADPKAKAFLVGSTLRQFEEVWDIGKLDDRGRDLLNILRARLAELPGGEQSFAPADVQALRRAPVPDAAELQAVLGVHGPQTHRWWRTGLDRAVGVAAIWEKLGNRVGTGFLVRAGDFGLEPADDLLVLTNFHVVNEHGASPGIKPEDAEIAFEASDNPRRFDVETIVWTSPPDRHDASFLRLKKPVEGIAAIPIASALPVLEPDTLVYIIGHPRGLELQFSFQDNELLDHEGPPDGKPQIPGVCRVHYTAPTEGGSSGSPVFNSSQWKVIGLHHKGGGLGMPRLNGKDGTYGANEGISVHCIREAIAGAMVNLGVRGQAAALSPAS